MSPTCAEVGYLLLQRASERDPRLRGVSVQHCDEADQDHERIGRAYMHVGHYPTTICYAAAADDLSLPFKVGLLVHEIGHLNGAEGEQEANEAGGALLGIHVEWRGRWILEWAKPPRWLLDDLWRRSRV